MSIQNRTLLNMALVFALLLSGFLSLSWGLAHRGYDVAAYLDHANWSAVAQERLDREDWFGARQRYEALLSVHPDSADGYEGLISALIGQREFDEARSVADSAETAGHTDLASGLRGQIEEAEQSL